MFVPASEREAPQQKTQTDELILRDQSASDEIIRDASGIQGSGKMLLALINDILEMRRIESGKIELEFVPVDLCMVFEGMKDLFHEQMNEKGIIFSVHTSQIEDRYVWCDKKNLNRILLNLLSNAYKFTPEGGSITASVSGIYFSTASAVAKTSCTKFTLALFAIPSPAEPVITARTF